MTDAIPSPPPPQALTHILPFWFVFTSFQSVVTELAVLIYRNTNNKQVKMSLKYEHLSEQFFKKNIPVTHAQFVQLQTEERRGTDWMKLIFSVVDISALLMVLHLVKIHQDFVHVRQTWNFCPCAW